MQALLPARDACPGHHRQLILWADLGVTAWWDDQRASFHGDTTGQMFIVRGLFIHASAGVASHTYVAGNPDLDVRTAAGLARVGHNHSLLQRLESKIREALEHGNVGPLIAMVEDYLAFPGLARWRASARYALEVARGGRRRLEGDSVSGAASESSLAERGAG